MVEGGLGMANDTVAGGGEMRGRSLDAGDRPRVRDLGGLLPLSISNSGVIV